MAYSPALAARTEFPAASGNFLHDDLKPNTFAPLGGYGSNTQFVTQYDRPLAQLPGLVNRHATFVGFARMLSEMGMKRPVKTTKFGHHEKVWNVTPFKFTSIQTASGGAGTQVIVNLHADTLVSTGVKVGGVVRSSSAFTVGDTFQTISGSAQFRIMSLDVVNNRATIIPLLSTVNLIAPTIAANESYAWIGNAHGEGSNLPGTKAIRTTAYSNECQIIKTAMGGTGTDMTNAVRLHPQEDGSIYVLLENQMRENFDMARDMALLVGQNANNALLVEANPELGHDVQIATTEGLLPFAEANGVVDTYTAGSYALTDLYNVANYFDGEFVANRDLCVWQGNKIFQEVEILLKEQVKQFAYQELNAIFANKDLPTDPTFQNDPKAFGLTIGFYACMLGNYNFYFKKMPAFSHPMMLGGASYTYPNYQLIHPIGTTTDANNGIDLPIVGYAYKDLAGYSRDVVFDGYHGVGSKSFTGAGNASFGYDVSKAGLVSEIGFWGSRGNQFYVQKV